MKHVIFLLCLLSMGCGAAANSNTNANANNNVNTKLSANGNTKREAEIALELKTKKEEIHKALQAFIDRNYKGWKFAGSSVYIGGVSHCDATDPCIIHLTRGKEGLMIPIVIETFRDPDGKPYWAVYQASQLDLLRRKLEREKEGAAELAREEQAAESERETEAYREWDKIESYSDDYDPPDS